MSYTSGAYATVGCFDEHLSVSTVVKTPPPVRPCVSQVLVKGFRFKPERGALVLCGFLPSVGVCVSRSGPVSSRPCGLVPVEPQDPDLLEGNGSSSTSFVCCLFGEEMSELLSNISLYKAI